MSKALFFVTYTPNNDVWVGSLECCGWEVVRELYERKEYAPGQMVQIARDCNPDLIVWVGALTRHPAPEVLRGLRGVAPMVLLCGDLSDDGWKNEAHHLLHHECFDLYISMDGFASPGFVPKLTPVDTRPYLPKYWNERTTPCGFYGGYDTERYNTIPAVGAVHAGFPLSYKELAEFMCNCKTIVNTPRSGSDNSDHVKGRVVETGFAGAVLLERRNHATSQWFRPGIDYVEYLNPTDGHHRLQWLMERPEEAQEIAASLHQRVVTEHSPAAYWGDICSRLNIK